MKYESAKRSEERNSVVCMYVCMCVCTYVCRRSWELGDFERANWEIDSRGDPRDSLSFQPRLYTRTKAYDVISYAYP